EEGLRFLGTFGMLNAHLLFTREVYPTSAYQSLANLAPAPSRSGAPGERPAVPDGICIGDPKGIIAAAKRWESIGVDQINVLLNASEVLTQDQVLASLRLFAKEVMPVFECWSGPATPRRSRAVRRRSRAFTPRPRSCSAWRRSRSRSRSC